MSKFVVLKVGWEYDDCKHIAGDPNRACEFVGPIFDTREEAEEAAVIYTAEDIPGLIVTNHGYGPSDIFDEGRYQELVEVLNLEVEEGQSASEALINWWHENGKIPAGISLEQAIEITRCLGIELYTVEDLENLKERENNGW